MFFLLFVIFGVLNVFIQATSIDVTLYYEALCPHSQTFITSQLYPTYKLLPKFLKIKLIPYGNAHIVKLSNGRFNFICQHGPDECYSNEIQACAISKFPKKSLKFINCVMASSNPSNDKNLKRCCRSSKISWKSLRKCYSSGLGHKLFLKNSRITAQAHPYFTSVPAIFINNFFNRTLQHLTENKFFKTVCDLLHGKPKACQ